MDVQRFKAGPAVIAVIVIVALVVIMTLSGLVVLDPGYAGVQFRRFPPSARGVKKEVLGPGLHWVMPGNTTVIKYSTRTETYTMSSRLGEGVVRDADTLYGPTKEGLKVGLDLTMAYRLDKTRLPEIHDTLGETYADKIIRPTIRTIVRTALSKAGIQDVYSEKREQLQNEAEKALIVKLGERGIIVESLLLRDVIFPSEYEKAIEAKQIAEQDAQKMEFLLQRETKEADRRKIEAEGIKTARIIEAEGEAEALRQVNAVLQENPDLLQYMYIDKLAEDIEVLVVPSGTGTLINPTDFIKGRGR